MRRDGQPGNIIRFCDYEKRSRSADACEPRDPCDADVIVLPVIRIDRDLAKLAGDFFR